jgi:hypothetical protein
MQRSRSRCRIQQHVPPGAADLLVAAEQALSPVSGRFRDVDGGGVPGYGSSPNSTARWASSSANSRSTTQPWAGGVVGQDGSCAVMCRLSLWSASRAAPIADLASEARQPRRVSAPIRPAPPVNLGLRGLITLVQTFPCVFHLRVMSLARPLHRLVPDDRSDQDQGDQRCKRTVPGARTGATGHSPTPDQRQRCAWWWAGVCGRWMSADSRSWPPGTRRPPSTWGPATAATCWPRPPRSPTGSSSASTPTRPG